jgi:hypothetical protein
MGVCSGCGLKKRLTSKGLVYTHKNPLLPGSDCEGSRKPVQALVPMETVLAAVEEFRASIQPTGKRTLRQRLRDRFKRMADKLDDAQDVFDE